jgi:hypothetical protein
MQRVVCDYLNEETARSLAAEITSNRRNPYTLIDEILDQITRH